MATVVIESCVRPPPEPALIKRKGCMRLTLGPWQDESSTVWLRRCCKRRHSERRVDALTLDRVDRTFDGVAALPVESCRGLGLATPSVASRHPSHHEAESQPSLRLLGRTCSV
jgi:hypothetical protein